MDLTKKLKELRVKKGLTQQQVAETLYVSTHAVSQWERGKRTPDLETLVKLGELYNAPLVFKHEDEDDTLYIERHFYHYPKRESSCSTEIRKALEKSFFYQKNRSS